MSAKRPYVPGDDTGREKTPARPAPPTRPAGTAAGTGKGEGEGEAEGERQAGGQRSGLRRPFVAGGASAPASPETESESEGTGAGAGAGAEAGAESDGDYIDFDFDALLAPGEIPAVLREESAAGATPADRPTARGVAAGASHLYGIGEELLRLRRQLELRKEEAKVLAQLQDEADAPTTRDLIEAAFAAGYFAGKGELERRIGRLR